MTSCKHKNLFSVVLIAILITAIPLTTENVVFNKKLRMISKLPSLELNRIHAYQANPKLPIKADSNSSLRILHFGDSHIQAGFLTGEVRRLLANFLNDSLVSMGYAFPYNIAGTNSPVDYSFSVTGSWAFSKIVGSDTDISAGLSGMVMETYDNNTSISISTKNAKRGDKLFDEVTFFVNVGEIEVNVDCAGGTIVNQSKYHVTIKLTNAVSELSVSFNCNNQNQKPLRVSGLLLVNSLSKLIYSSAGLNGADVKSYLKAGEFENQLRLIDPHIVIVSLGTNDAYHPLFDSADFSNNLAILIDKIELALPNATVLLTIPGDHLVSKTSPNLKLLQVKDAIFDLAIKKSCCVWDFHSIMGGEGSIRLWNSIGLTAPDYLHFNAKGYQLQGELLFEALTLNDALLNNSYSN